MSNNIPKKLETCGDLMTVKDVMEIMRVGRNTAGSIIHSEGFPMFKIGNQIRISKKAFIKWIDKQIELVGDDYVQRMG